MVCNVQFVFSLILGRIFPPVRKGEKTLWLSDLFIKFDSIDIIFNYVSWNIVPAHAAAIYEFINAFSYFKADFLVTFSDCNLP